MGAITIRSVMQSRHVTARPDTPAAELTGLIGSAPYSEIFVTDSDARLIGLITPAELAGSDLTAPIPPTAGAIARACPMPVGAGDHVADVIERMQADEEPHLPVVDDQVSRKLLGIVREAGLLRAVNRVLLDAQHEEIGESPKRI